MPDNKPIRLVHCAWATGIGGGVARFDAYLNRYLNRDIIDPTFVITKKRISGEVMFDEAMEFVYTGDHDRFEALLKEFAFADVVSFQGGFDPLVCEAARVSGAPALVEIIHTIEPGGIYPGIDVTVCISETVRAQQADKNRAEVIYNGIDTDEFTFREEANPKDKIVILQATNRDKPYFNLDELANDILSIDPRIELWLAGGGQDGTSTDRIKFFGLHPDIGKLYRKADILVMFTKSEAFGLAIVEAMASGAVPVVINENGPAEIVTDSVDGFIAPSSEREELIEAINRAVKARSSEKWSQMRINARRTVERKFKAERCVREYEKLYLKLIELKGRRKKPGPLSGMPTAEAHLADALFHLQNARWADCSRSLEKMASGDETINQPACALAAAKFARQATARGEPALAGKIYRKIYFSGFKYPEWMQEWLLVLPQAEADDFPVNDLLELDGYKERTVMLVAERLINKGDIMSAIAILEKGATTNPESDEIQKVYELLKARFGSCDGK
ncbi:hypothetical protein MNBD_NITROSPINAE02-1026 [hydrothermal vent metagenome]|uniref:Glycosyl transferase family 1 domain-containing protein n=1 Tax=hydrothermal vent metagenome TaxID=652676 RepID=A0A3B1C0X4_9ZZZZ